MMDRREFLAILSSTLAAASSIGLLPASARAHSSHIILARLGTVQKAYTFFTQPEADFIEAAVARLIPADDLGPGAREAEVAFFIDQQLSGAYGTGGRTYHQGPWGAESTYQGYQLPLTPRELYRVGIAATERYCEQTFKQRFGELKPEQQDEILHGLEMVAGGGGAVFNQVPGDLEAVPGTTFFAYLLRDTKDGFFADPVYGGNKDMIGWKLVGFPGVAASYIDFVERYNEPYPAEPVSIREMQQAQVPLDHHGHPIHRFAAVEDAGRTLPASSGISTTGEWNPAVSGPRIIV
jgi:gluconate 2-dehydrogenase gamma chain